MLEAIAALTAERQRRVAQAAALQRALDAMLWASQDSNADDEHDPEGATIAFERSQLLVQLAHAKKGVVEVDGALARAHGGTYDTCETCGGLIAPERLAARPAAVTCIACASRCP